MGDNRTFKLRVTYRKTGRLALLSHLEIARALERCVRRAALPYAVSEGFSPHMRIAFGSALPVGVGSTCEIFDLALTRYVAPQKALAALQAVAAADLMPVAAEYLGNGARAASVALPVGVYEAQVAGGEGIVSGGAAGDCDGAGGCPDDAAGVPVAGRVLPVPETITVARKKGDRVYTVADYLEEAPRIVAGGECGGGDGTPEVAPAPESVPAPGDGTFTVRFALRARDTGAIRADVFLRSCLRLYNGREPKVIGLTRIEQRA